MEDDKKIVIHCRMGIGRAYLLAAGVLKNNGIDKNRVFEVISKYRVREVTAKKEQIEWLEKLKTTK